MGRQIINTIECSKCHREFGVATEDIEWEHLTDAGEVEDSNPIHDFNVFQTVDCPYCDSKNQIVFHAKGESEASFNSMKVVSLEEGDIIDNLYGSQKYNS